ncbi:GOLPH3/VPS74 family protein, partial [Saccharopolyspora sp. 5N708]|uniref:GOLPH3/VPS74 family protein n=1 Tax=Saccharopolyspora sp. 5N708 TaxID=3457424 RepID=UPI003FD03BC4
MAEFTNPLTLPDEFVLLLHRDNGSHYVSANPNTATAAAEIGELALRDRIDLDGTAVRLVDSGWSGLPWMDRLLAELQRWSGHEDRPVELSWWLPCRTGAFLAHRSVLVEQGLLRHERRKFLGVLPDDRYHPDPPTREALLAGLREAACGARPVDARLALLAALVHHSGLVYALGFDRAQRHRLKSIAETQDLGDAVSAAVAAMLVAIAAIPSWLGKPGAG